MDVSIDPIWEQRRADSSFNAYCNLRIHLFRIRAAALAGDIEHVKELVMLGLSVQPEHWADIEEDACTQN